MDTTATPGLLSTAMNESAFGNRTLGVSELITFDQLQVANLCIFSIGIPVCVLGIFSNSANITVFYKMGFSSASNVCLFCLAVTDWLCLAYILVVVVGCHPLIEPVHLPMMFGDAIYIISSVYYGFSAMCSWITALINMERSCCVAFPMKVRYIQF